VRRQLLGVLSVCRRVAAPSAAYLGTNIIRTALPFLLIPFLTKVLAPAEYGIVSLYQTLVLFIVPFVPFNVSTAATIAYYKTSREEFARYVTSCLAPPVLICIVLMAGMWIAPDWMLSRFAVPRVWLVLLPLFGLSQLFPNLLLAVYQVEHKAISFGFFTTGMSAVNVGLTVFFISRLKWGWQGRLEGILWAQILFSLFAFFLLRQSRSLNKRISWQYIKDIARFCVPLIPHSLGASAIDMGDRLIIAALMGTAALGEYTIAAQIGQMLVIFVASLNQAWTPFLYRELEGIVPQRRREVVRATYAVAGIIVLAFAGLVTLAPMAARAFVDKRFWPSLHLVPWIAAGYMFNGFYYLIGNYIFYAKQTRMLALLTFGNAIFSIGLTYVGVRHFGIQGAAWATTVSWAVFFFAAWTLSNKVFPMPWALWRPMVPANAATNAGV